MYKIGIDVGGTNLAAGITNHAGELIHKDSAKVKQGATSEVVLQDMYNLVTKMLQETNITEDKIQYIGIGVPGACDYYTGLVIFTPNLNLSGVNLRTEFAKHTSIPVYVDNDANCAALGEKIQGAAKNYNGSVTITLGTGVGVGVVINNMLINGIVEAGHITIDPNGPVCGCGNKGCLESYASATALINAAKQHDPTIKEAKEIFDAVGSPNNPWASELIKDYIFYLGVGINSLINSYPIQAVILGGGISKQGDALIQPLKKVLQERAFNSGNTVDILQATLGNDAGIIGAAELASRET